MLLLGLHPNVMKAIFINRGLIIEPMLFLFTTNSSTRSPALCIRLSSLFKICEHVSIRLMYSKQLQESKASGITHEIVGFCNACELERPRTLQEAKAV